MIQITFKKEFVASNLKCNFEFLQKIAMKYILLLLLQKSNP